MILRDSGTVWQYLHFFCLKMDTISEHPQKDINNLIINNFVFILAIKLHFDDASWRQVCNIPQYCCGFVAKYRNHMFLNHL